MRLQPGWAAAIAMGLLAASVPAASDSEAERNRAWLLDHLGPDFDLDASYAGTAGGAPVTWSGAELLQRTLARMGDVDMPAMAAAAVVTPGGDFGDVWLIGFGPGTCGPNVLLVEQPIFIPIDGQMWIYNGWVGVGSASGFSGFSIGWTSKTSGTFGPEPLGYAPVSDFFCFDGVIFFPFIDGVWWQ